MWQKSEPKLFNYHWMAHLHYYISVSETPNTHKTPVSATVMGSVLPSLFHLNKYSIGAYKLYIYKYKLPACEIWEVM